MKKTNTKTITDQARVVAENILFEIMARKPEKIDDMFRERLAENIEYMKENGHRYLSTGSGKDLPSLQKTETLVERTLEGDDSYIPCERVYRIYLDSIPKSKLNAIATHKELQAEMERQVPIQERLGKETFNAAIAQEFSIDSGKEASYDGCVVYEWYIENHFHMKKDVWSSEIVKKAEEKILRKLSEHVCGGAPGSGKPTLDDVIARSITSFNRVSTTPNEWDVKAFGITKHERYEELNDTQMYPFLLFSGMSGWRTGFGTGYMEQKKIRKIVSNAVSMVIKSYIIYYAIEEINAKMIAMEKGAVKIKTDGKNMMLGKTPIASESDLRFLFQRAKEIDYNEMMMMCYFASAVEINREWNIQRDAELIEHSMSGRNTATVERELFEANIRIKQLEEENAALKKKCGEEEAAKLKAQRQKQSSENTKKKVAEQNKAILQMERSHNAEIAKKDGEINRLNRKVEELQQENENMRQEVADLSKAIEDAEAGGTGFVERDIEEKVDHEKKYYFVCDDDTICNALKREFPNSKCRTDYNLTPANAEQFDAAVFIIERIEHHSTYYRMKNMCKKAGLPIIHCDTKGIRTIKLLLIQQGFGKTAC